MTKSLTREEITRLARIEMRLCSYVPFLAIIAIIVTAAGASSDDRELLLSGFALVILLGVYTAYVVLYRGARFVKRIRENGHSHD